MQMHTKMNTSTYEMDMGNMAVTAREQHASAQRPVIVWIEHRNMATDRTVTEQGISAHVRLRIAHRNRTR
jgi:hypothetical protein